MRPQEGRIRFQAMPPGRRASSQDKGQWKGEGRLVTGERLLGRGLAQVEAKGAGAAQRQKGTDGSAAEIHPPPHGPGRRRRPRREARPWWTRSARHSGKNMLIASVIFIR